MLEKLFVDDRGFYERVFRVAVPIIAQNIITIGVNMMDTVMLGKFGEVQLSASSLANDFINIFQILCMGMGCGAAVLTAQYWGSRNIDSLKKAVTTMLRFMIVISLLFTLAVIFVSPQIMKIYTSDPEVIEKGILYFEWSVPTFILMGISLTLTQILRSVRDVRVPLYTSIISFFVNIFFNWVFIFGHLGMPRMEIAGAALGTVIARIVETVLIGGYFFFREKNIGYRPKDIMMPCGDVTGKYFSYSLPVMASDSLLAFGNSAVAVIIGHMGTAFVAANAIIAMIQRFCTVFTSGMGQAAHTVIGNRIGEGRREQAFREAITLLSLSVVFGLLTAVIMRLIGPSIIRFYDISEETYDIGMQMLNAMSLLILFQAMQSTITKGILRGGGDTRFVMLIDAGFLWAVSVPLGYLTGLVLHMNAFIVMLSLRIDWVIKSLIGSARVISRKWLKEIDL